MGDSATRPWTTVELFCGIGGFRIASDALQIDTVWANEIEERAASVYVRQFGDRGFVRGDLRQHTGEIPQHDILTAGFPCQPFSSAGKKKGVYDPRGTLFAEILAVIQRCQPRFFVLENVKRLLSMDSGKHFATILRSSIAMGYLLEWRVLNATWFGLPQNRERVVIVGSRDNGSLRSYLRAENRGLKSLENVALKFDPSGIREIGDKAQKFKNWGLSWGGKFIDKDVRLPVCEPDRNLRLRHILEKNPSSKFFFTEDTLKRIENSEKVDRYFNGVEILYNQKGGARMGYSIFGVNGVAPTLTSTTSRHYERYRVGDDYRRLTNVEYARLQGFPDGHCDGISPYHQYSLFGNAVPPCLVEWVMNRLVRDRFTSVEFAGSTASTQLELSLDR
ncbi:MAG: DNA (cytosine-5-)-methyltransferase [Geitlerinemataceae cyanobacterium]